jgi:hypothetical protein
MALLQNLGMIVGLSGFANVPFEHWLKTKNVGREN